MPSYKVIDEATVQNTVHANGKLSTVVRVPLSWIGKKVEIRIIEK